MPKNTNVILIVDTDTIAKDTSDKFEDSVVFFDDRGAIPGFGGGFDSEVDASKKITWRGIAKDPEGRDKTVRIIKIKHVSGNQLLKKDEYEDKRNNGQVVGHVKDVCGGEEYYEITFIANGIKYTIDPKMHT